MNKILEEQSLRFLYGRTCKQGRALLSGALSEIGLHLGQDVILRMLWDTSLVQSVRAGLEMDQEPLI